jgi:hypothetical protein
MSPPRRKPTSRSRSKARPAPTRDFWRDDEVDDDLDVVIRPNDDPAALIRSLGPPPLPNHETAAEYYFAAVYDRATTLAIALAAASGILAPDDPED